MLKLKEEYLTYINLCKKLKERIKGRIFITVHDDYLNIHIVAGKGYLRKYKYRCNINEINKLYLVDIVYKIERDYKKFIGNRFLYQIGRCKYERIY